MIISESQRHVKASDFFEMPTVVSEELYAQLEEVIIDAKIAKSKASYERGEYITGDEFYARMKEKYGVQV